MAPVILNVAYPSGSDFNVEYYTSKHIPLAVEGWKAITSGLKDWKLYTPLGDNSPYAAVLEVTFESMEALVSVQTKAPAELQTKLKEDLVNYSTKPPSMWVSELKASL
ncbi:hypothetical protein PFICI_13950 [Pestalotiopsis fici W106-1]|uniref:EthD domain-containing protein n=1 Tax=Pestalotiopsis fici (strain W106-1 / CGMCC3.15140) TaxID=1229662 RepID=W3WJY1_PESFW|nr:uncharacterized protein PFICI_13950 [Pestalotiopsis fici W106-1]ETS74084.1 hypothetical protein PFICI_13950 [Pestalotiopsis fici W106-1]